MMNLKKAGGFPGITTIMVGSTRSIWTIPIIFKDLGASWPCEQVVILIEAKPSFVLWFCGLSA